MRSVLAKLHGVRRRFQGVFVRFGKKSGYKDVLTTTILLKDIADVASGKIVADHLWFTMGKGFEKLDLSDGDIIRFDARVTEYIKGYQGRQDEDDYDYKPIEHDFRLSFPTKFAKFTRQKLTECYDPVELFNKAEKFVRENGFAREVDWCDNRPSFDEMTDQEFLREYAWVVFNSGMRNATIVSKWKELCKAFLWFNSDRIIKNEDEVRKDALNVFGHYLKVDAVIEVAKIVSKKYLEFKHKVNYEDTLKALDELPFIGEVTKFHLARNIGFDFIKPDRHLVRLASKYETTPFELCNLIHKKTGRRLGTIDVVLWRYCEQQGQTKLRS